MLEKDSLSSVVDLGVIISQLSASVFGREDSLWSFLYAFVDLGTF